MRIFTIGYQNLTADLYVRALVNAGVGLVIDVREHAWSQRPEFVKSTLQNSLSKAGIEYCHLKSAGNPAANRRSARSAAECMKRYRHHLSDNPDCVSKLLSLLRVAEQSGRLGCLTCYERRPEDCHRSVLISELIRLEPDLMPIHLEPSIDSKKNKKSALKKPRSLLSNSFLTPSLLPFT
jgi:uncharacterized protein (DUF488 family)